MVSALYVYTKECHKALKAAAVFPFQMELQIDTKHKELDDESLIPWTCTTAYISANINFHYF